MIIQKWRFKHLCQMSSYLPMSYDSQFVFVKGEPDNPVAAVSFMNSFMTLLNAVMSSPTEKKDGSNAMV